MSRMDVFKLLTQPRTAHYEVYSIFANDDARSLNFNDGLSFLN